MPRRMVAVLAAGLCLLAATASQAASRVERVVSPGGITAWLVREPSIPFLAIQFAFRGAGAGAEPAGKEGLANLLSGMLDEGAGDLDSQAFQARLSQRSIRLGFSADRDSFRGGMEALSRDLDEAFSLLGLALSAPRFDAEPLARVRDQVLTGIARDAEDPDAIAQRRFAATAYAGHPYGRPVEGTADSVAALGAADLRAFGAHRLSRGALLIGASGDVEPAALGRLLDLAFAHLPAQGEPDAVPEAVPQTVGVQVVAQAIPQSVVMFAMPGPKRDDPDFMPAFVMNHILGGGGFSSRLMNEVREKRGLVYGISTGLVALDHAGMLSGRFATQNARVGAALEVVRGELGRLAAGDVGEAEVDAAKAFLTGSFPLQLDSNARLARMLVTMQLQRLGIDYLERRNALVAAVGRDDVVRAARRWLRPEVLGVVVVGEPAGVTPTH